MISNISIWEELLLEIERPERILKWIYVPGHAGLEGNDTAHRLASEGMCMNTVWALPRTAFSRPIDDTQTTHEQPLCPAATPPLDNIYAVQDTTVIGGWTAQTAHQTTTREPYVCLGWLGLVEMSELEEEAS